MGKRKTHEDFVNFVKRVEGDNYLVLSKYTKVGVPVRMKHVECGLEWDVFPENFIYKNSRCRDCSRGKLNSRVFKERLKETVGDEYELVGEYKSSNSKLKIKHNVCGYIYETISYRLINEGKRCPYCNCSKAEKCVMDFLNRNKIKFEYEKTFDDCRNKSLLRFDFYVKGTLIELDGQQHFKSINHFGGTEALKQTQQNDQIKNDYAASKGIKLIRIPYWDYNNIEEILDRELKDIK